MEHQDTYLQHPAPPRNSSSSAIDLTRTTAGIASAPPSPSLDPSDSQSSFSRRRTSWGNRLVDAGQDPLRLELPSNSGHATAASPRHIVNDDPFYSPTDEPISLAWSAQNTRYGDQHGDMNAVYSTSQAGPSTTSLIPTHGFQLDGHREDDEAHLTSNMSRDGTPEGWNESYREDPERSAGATPRTRRRTVRYSVTPSPLKKTGTAIKSVSQNLRRVSLRVVNLAGAGLENQLRLADGDEAHTKLTPAEGDGGEEEQLPDLSRALPIRGRTLGCLGSDSKLRLALFNFLVYQCVFFES